MDLHINMSRCICRIHSRKLGDHLTKNQGDGPEFEERFWRKVLNSSANTAPSSECIITAGIFTLVSYPPMFILPNKGKQRKKKLHQILHEVRNLHVDAMKMCSTNTKPRKH